MNSTTIISSCKDVPELPILQFLCDRWVQTLGPATFYDGEENSVAHAMPHGTPDKVRLQKMRKLVRRGLISGCACGCRGDYEITHKGLEYLYFQKIFMEIPKRCFVKVQNYGFAGYFQIKLDGAYFVATHLEMKMSGSAKTFDEARKDLFKVVRLFSEEMIEKGAFEDFLVEKGVRYEKYDDMQLPDLNKITND